MTNFHDNAVEADGGMHNVRIMRNMMLNSASHPFCNQPDLGGPDPVWVCEESGDVIAPLGGL
jgi:hypothetical protein